MMLVPTRVAPSPIHGLGLFTEEPVRAGAAVCIFDLRYDTRFTFAEVAAMPPLMRAFVETYGFQDQEEAGLFCVEFDNGRLMNHADEPTLIQDGATARAVRDLASGEELTYDYRLLGLDVPGDAG
jgi:uncharacterized protein